MKWWKADTGSYLAGCCGFRQMRTHTEESLAAFVRDGSAYIKHIWRTWAWKPLCWPRSLVCMGVHVCVYPCAGRPRLRSELADLTPLRWAVSRARITHFKESHCHTLMWQTAASATDISTDWGLDIPSEMGEEGWRGRGWRAGAGGFSVCVQQTHCRANINHVDSHKIIRADHSQSLHSSSVWRTARMPISVMDSRQCT